MAASSGAAKVDELGGNGVCPGDDGGGWKERGTAGGGLLVRVQLLH